MTQSIIIGVDEVGRGCIAGDLLVCAYRLREGLKPDHVRTLRSVAMDSKAFGSRARREAAMAVVEAAGIFAIARRSPAEIEASNIRLATLSAMREAAEVLRATVESDAPSQILVDGKDVPPGLEGPVEAVVKGDAKVLEISCASILAKVRRDQEMEGLDAIYPGYGFATHAGYGTRQHREAIGRLGLSPIHRTWASKFVI